MIEPEGSAVTGGDPLDGSSELKGQATELSRPMTREQAAQRGLAALERAARISGSMAGLKGKALYRQLNSLVNDLLEVEICGIMLYDADQQVLVAQVPALGVPDEVLAGYRIPLGEDSPAHRYWEEDIPVVINDTQADPLVHELGLYHLAHELGVHSTMVCGLLHEGRLIGLIQVCNKRDGTPFDLEDVRLLSIFARQAAATIQNAQLLEEIQGHVDEAASLSSLYRMTSALAQAVDLKEMLSIVLQHVRQVLDYDSCLILLVSADGQALRIEAVDAGDGPGRPSLAGMDLETRGIERILDVDIPVDAGINGWIFREGKPVLIADADLDPRRLHIKGRTESIRAAVGAPLITDGQIIGTIYATRRRPNSFTEAHLDFLSFTAAQVAAAVRRARLLDQTRRRAEEMETLLSTAAVIASSLDQDQILDAIYEQAGRIMDTSAFFAAICDKDSDTVCFRLIYEQGQHLEPFCVALSESRSLTAASAAYTIRTGRPLLIRNWPEEQSSLPFGPLGVDDAGSSSLALTEPCLSWLAVPIVAQDSVLGAIGARSSEAHAFTSKQERLLSAIANQAGISLQNARLLADLRLVNTDLHEMVAAQAHLLQTIERTISALNTAEDLADLRRQLEGDLGYA